MARTLSKIGNSQVLIFDSALLELTHLKGGQVNITVHEGDTMVLTPLSPTILPEQAASSAKRLIDKSGELFRQLSK